MSCLAIDACLAREGGIAIVDTDRSLARRVGHILAAAGRGWEDHVDATVVATCALAGGGLILTVDGDDIEALTPDGSGIFVRGLIEA